MEFTFLFVEIFFYILSVVSPILATLFMFILLLGVIVGYKESWSRFDSLYWAMITATTIGYGDMKPTTKTSKILSVLIGFCGLVLTGMIVTIAVHSGSEALKAHIEVEKFHQIIQSQEIEKESG